MKKNKQFDMAKPIDFVIAWVDGADEAWQKEKAEYDGSLVTTANSEVRFRDWDNLQYWFRAVEKYAPWVNKIHFVTWGHLPEWLDITNPKLNIVNHKDYIPKEYLPTFSSHTIELNLHRIEGLAEQFVYFNDDIFLNKPVKPEDFFKNGNPLDTAALDCIYFGKDSAGFFHAADLVVINTHFNMKQSLKQNFKKWFYLKYGIKRVLKTAMLYNWPWFAGIFCQHVANNFLKSTFEEVWEKEFETLDKTCKHRFRKSGDVNQWVMKYWQLAKGTFEARPLDFAQCYHVKKRNLKYLCRDIREHTHAMICANDNARTVNFEATVQRVKECFDIDLGEKSSFEK